MVRDVAFEAKNGLGWFIVVRGWAIAARHEQSPEPKMTYVAKVLQPGELVVHIGRLRWIMYLPSIVLLCVGLAVLMIPTAENRIVIYGISALLVAIAALSAFPAWLKQFTTEIVVTDRRIIYKTGLVSRETWEMNMHRVETVGLEQGIIGRLLNYGAVDIRGTGAGIETLKMIADPLALRSAITAPEM